MTKEERLEREYDRRLNALSSVVMSTTEYKQRIKESLERLGYGT